MSASRERKKRQEYLAGGGLDRKAAREAEQKAAERRSNLFYGAIAILFVIVTVALLVINSGILKRNATAVTIGDDTYTAADLSYYYMQSYNQIYSMASYIGLDTNRPLSSQAAWGSTEEGAQTWDEYLKEQAVETMRFVTAANAAAKEEGFQLSEEDEQAIADNIQELKDTAKTNGMSYKSYLSALYGNLMTTSVYEENLREYYTALAYESAYSDSLTYTADEVQAVYDENPDAYDKVSYQLVTVDGAAPSTEDEEGNTVEPTEEESSEAWEEAQRTAQTILDAYASGESLETVASDFETATFSSSDGASSSSTTKYVEWCFEDGRKAGDSAVLEDEDNSKIYVVVFEDRYLDQEPTVSVRHILIDSSSVTGDDETEASDEEIKAKAEEILAMWDGTEDGFASLAEEYSKDTVSAASGGLIGSISSSSSYVQEFKDWALDSSRQTGDTGIIQSDYGYHIMYYVGGGQPAWYISAEDSLRNEDVTAWQESLVEPYEAVTNEKGMSYVTR